MQRKLNCVLLIDDDEPTNFLNRMLIEEIGCAGHIEVRQSAREALNYLNNCNQPFAEKAGFIFPDLIFLDLNMPAMNGWEFLEKYHDLKKTFHKKIVVVMLTTSLSPDDEMKAKDHESITDFISKPLTTKAINEILKTYLAVS